jgi:hypothetical protein
MTDRQAGPGREWRDPFLHQPRRGAPAGLRARLEQLAGVRGQERARAHDQAQVLLEAWESRAAVRRLEAELTSATAGPLPASSERVEELRRTRATLRAPFENAIGEAFNDHGCSLEDVALVADDLTRDELVAIVFDDAALMRKLG